MPRLLLITFCFPPTEIIGSVRPAALAKFLPQFGWDPLILTPKVEKPRADSRIIETDYQSVLARWKARLGFNGEQTLHEQLGLPVSSQPGLGHFHTHMFELAKYLISYPDETKGWIPFALKAIEEIRDQQSKIDAILTTSPPISVHLLGSKAKKLLGCRWVADLRDLWTQNYSTSYPLLDSLQIGLERRTLNEADGLVTVSDPWATRLKERYPSKSIFTITNGFDPDHFAAISRKLTTKFTITHSGMLYEGRRDPRMLFEVLRDLFDEQIMCPEDVQVRFYGRVERWVATLVRRYRLSEVVRMHGVVPRQEALQRQAESQILLLLGWTDPRETGQHSGKLFEYLGAARPILAVGGAHSVLTDTLDETHAGTHTLCKKQVRDFLVSAHSEFKSKGYVSYRGEPSAIRKYTHLQMTGQFVEVLNRLTPQSTPAVNDHAKSVLQNVGG